MQANETKTTRMVNETGAFNRTLKTKTNDNGGEGTEEDQIKVSRTCKSVKGVVNVITPPNEKRCRETRKLKRANRKSETTTDSEKDVEERDKSRSSLKAEGETFKK